MLTITGTRVTSSIKFADIKLDTRKIMFDTTGLAGR